MDGHSGRLFATVKANETPLIYFKLNKLFSLLVEAIKEKNTDEIERIEIETNNAKLWQLPIKDKCLLLNTIKTRDAEIIDFVWEQIMDREYNSSSSFQRTDKDNFLYFILNNLILNSKEKGKKKLIDFSFKQLDQRNFEYLDLCHVAIFLLHTIATEDTEIIEFVLNQIESEKIPQLSGSEVKSILSSTSKAEEKYAEIIKFVLNQIRPEEISQLSASEVQSLLSGAIKTKDMKIIEFVWDFFEKEQIFKLLYHKIRRILSEAFQTKNMQIIEYVWNKTATEKLSSLDILLEVIDIKHIKIIQFVLNQIGSEKISQLSTSEAEYLLSSAIKTKDMKIIKYVLNQIGSVRISQLLTSEVKYLLSNAIKTKDMKIIKFVATKIGSEKISQLSASKVKSLLSSAIKTKDMKIIKYVLNQIGSEKISQLSASEAEYLLSSAIKTEDIKIITIVWNLSPKEKISKKYCYVLKSEIERIKNPKNFYPSMVKKCVKEEILNKQKENGSNNFMKKVKENKQKTIEINSI